MADEDVVRHGFIMPGRFLLHNDAGLINHGGRRRLVAPDIAAGAVSGATRPAVGTMPPMGSMDHAAAGDAAQGLVDAPGQGLLGRQPGLAQSLPTLARCRCGAAAPVWVDVAAASHPSPRRLSVTTTRYDLGRGPFDPRPDRRGLTSRPGPQPHPIGGATHAVQDPP
jgi:hypothetical protein